MDRTALSPGLRGEARRRVTEADTAIARGSGDVPVFATPGILALMEAAACDAVAGSLAAGETSVGTWADLEHSAASALGVEIVATAELVEVDGRTLEFACEARDSAGVVARAKHRRAVVERGRFIERAETRAGR